MTYPAYFRGGSRDGETQPLDAETRTIVIGLAGGTAEAYVNVEETKLVDGVPHAVFELRTR